MIKQPLPFCALALLLGILSSLWLSISFTAAFLSAFVFFAAVCITRLIKAKRMLLMLLMMALLFTFGNYLTNLKQIEYQACRFDKNTPVAVSGSVDHFTYHKNRVYVFLNDVSLNAEHTGTVTKVSSFFIFLDLEDFEKLGLKIGNHILAKCVFYPFQEARNYGNFDEKAYYHSLGIAGKAKVKYLTLTDNAYLPFRQGLFMLQKKLEHSI